MNPNALEDQPHVSSPEDIIRATAEKLFSEPDPEAAILINKRIKELNTVNQLRDKVTRENASRDVPQPLPAYPTFSSTPNQAVSNTSKGTVLNMRQGLRALEIQAGTPTICTDVYIQLIVDYANLWHSKNSGIDCRSPGTNPKFFHLPQSFYAGLCVKSAKTVADDVRLRLSREQFWKLRYFFIPVSFVPMGQVDAHVAVCAVSPEAKTVDFVCSGGDSGLPDSIRSDGAKCIPLIFAWLAELIGNKAGGKTFVPSEWRLRTLAGQRQNLWRGDCGIYTVTHVMALAFGYGFEDDLGAFPKEHQTRIIKRRKRYVQDLMFGGFKLYEEGSSNIQYYPLLDVKPSSLESDGFLPLPSSVLNKLPSWVPQPASTCYVKCPNKAALKLHCRRNAKLYPGYHKPEISGRGVSLPQFIRWVENIDKQRAARSKAFGIKFSDDGHEWIDPTTPNRKAVPRYALWGR